MTDAAVKNQDFALALAHCLVLEPDIKIAVAVSGGPDSMALLLLMKNWADSHQQGIIAVTVDHDLRADSAAEAAQINSWCKKSNIPHHILKWSHNKPDTGIMDAARKARYALLDDWCHGQRIKYLAVAHHRDDQAETILMRFAKGSGLDGLGGMRRSKSLLHTILIRPLLDFSKAQLIATCRHYNQSFFTDPSNANTKFARGRLRNVMHALADEGFSVDRLIDLSNRAQSAADALSWLADQALSQTYNHAEKKLNWTALQSYPGDIQERVFKIILMQIGNEPYPPRRMQLQGLLNTLRTGNFTKQTLHHCVIAKLPNGYVRFTAEQTALSD